MYRRILIGGVTAAAIIGAGGAALAATGSDTTSGSASSAGHATTSTHAEGHGRAKGHHPLRHVDHAQIVVRTKKGFVTRELIRGTVTQVSATSITVTSADHATDTFSITEDTKVTTRSGGKRHASSISAVSKGDRVFVGGVGAGTPVARHVVDRGTK